MILDSSWISWGVLVSPKIINVGLGAHGHFRKSRNHRNDGFEGLDIIKLKSYKIKLQIGAEEYYGACKHIFPIRLPYKLPENGTQMSKMLVFCFFRCSIGNGPRFSKT